MSLQKMLSRLHSEAGNHSGPFSKNANTCSPANMYLTALGLSFKQSYLRFSLCSGGLLILQLWVLDILWYMAADMSGMGSSLKQSVDVPLQKKNRAIFDLGYERSGACPTF